MACACAASQLDPLIFFRRQINVLGLFFLFDGYLIETKIIRPWLGLPKSEFRNRDTMNTSTLVQKVWNFCHTLRDDGVGYGDYLEQLTYLLFLKLAHEYAQEPYNRDTHIPKGYDWASLTPKVGEPLRCITWPACISWGKSLACWVPSFSRHKTRFKTRLSCRAWCN